VFVYSVWHGLSVIVSIGFIVIVESWRRLGAKGR
jgi:hypothetical protein